MQRQTMSTMIVNRNASRLVGQITFFSSAMVLPKKLNLIRRFRVVTAFGIWSYLTSLCSV